MNKTKKYTVYATGKNGDGYVESIMEIDTLEDFRIRIGMFAPDVVITIEENYDFDEKDAF